MVITLHLCVLVFCTALRTVTFASYSIDRPIFITDAECSLRGTDRVLLYHRRVSSLKGYKLLTDNYTYES